MDTPLNASANNAGAIFANNMFTIPQFQREYSWTVDEVGEFWSDLKLSLDLDSYFLGLMILTKPVSKESTRKQVVDGQQRIITLTLLANAIYHEAVAGNRKALADRVQASFLRALDFDSDEQVPRVVLSDKADNDTFRYILEHGQSSKGLFDAESVSAKINASYELLVKKLREDLRSDPFKRLGKWTEFLNSKLYFAVFVHPDPNSAYKVYEVINTRGKDLTTADLLKNFIISQFAKDVQTQIYGQWKNISKQFNTEGANNFVQYIRHVVTSESGYVLPKDLFDFLSNRLIINDRSPPRPVELIAKLNDNLPLYLQMIDPTSVGPASQTELGVFSALNDLSVLTVRPILLACATVPNAQEGMEYLLRLVVRRIVVGNLGTGNVERKFGEAARAITRGQNWKAMIDGLRDLNPPEEEFISQIRKRSFNKQVLSFIRRSIIQNTITPSADGTLHFIWTKGVQFGGMSEDEGPTWSSTIANTLLVNLDRRPKSIVDWDSFKLNMFPDAVPGERIGRLSQIGEWNVTAVESVGLELAKEAGRIWYDA